MTRILAYEKTVMRRLGVFMVCMGLLMTGCEYTADTNAPDVSRTSKRESQTISSHSEDTCESSATETMSPTPTILPEEEELSGRRDCVDNVTRREGRTNVFREVFFGKHATGCLPFITLVASYFSRGIAKMRRRTFSRGEDT